MAQPDERQGARRRFLICSTAIALTPVSSRLALAQQKVEESSQQAKALNYVHNAEKAKDPKRQLNQYCYNCQFFQSKKKEGWGPCQIFAGNLVAAKGWCSSWVKQT